MKLPMNHPLAVINRGAKIGKDVTISPFVTIDDDVVIGDGCWIGPNVVIQAGTRLGKNCKVFPGAVLGSVPQDLKFRGEKTTLEIGDNVIIREYCTLNRGTKALGKTIIGSNSLLMAYVHVAHDCIIGDHCILANNATLAGHVEIDDHVVLGGMSAVQQFIKIGSHAMLGGGALLNKDVPPFVRAARYPVSYIGINTIGLRRRGFDSQKIEHIKHIYSMLFLRNNNRSQALKMIEQEVAQSIERQLILDFVKDSKNGIIKGLRPLGK